MNLSSARCQILGVAFLSVGFFAYGQFVSDSCPVMPVDPTEDSCRAYTEEHSKYVNDLHEKLQQCQTPESLSVSVVTVDGKPTTVAWPLCVGIREQFDAACNDGSVSDCFTRASNIAQEKDAKAVIEKTWEQAKTVEDAYHKAQSLQEAISDPREFFKKALLNSMADAEINKLFFNKGDNYALGNDAFRYAMEFARRSQGQIFQPDNFLASKVTSACLNLLTSTMSSNFRQLDGAMEQIKTFHLDNPNSPSSNPIQTTPAPTPSASSSDSNNVDCAVWQQMDSEMREDLRERNQAAFDAYQKKCGSN